MRSARLRIAATANLLAVMTAAAAASVFMPVRLRAQDASELSTAPDGGPAWTRLIRLGDGRMFITDGVLTVDVKVANPAMLPEEAVEGPGATIVELFLTQSLPKRFPIARLTLREEERTYVSPNGVALDAKYVDWIARAAGTRKLQFRMAEAVTPVVIVLDGKAVGFVMPEAVRIK